MIALARNGQVSRSRLSEFLWSPPRDPLGNLRQLISFLNAHLTAENANFLKADRRHVGLDFCRVRTDFHDLEGLARADDLPGADKIRNLEVGEILGDLDIGEAAFEEWAEEQRSYLQRNTYLALMHLLERAEDATNDALIEAISDKLLKIEPASEEPHRALIKVANRRGDKGMVIARYKACEESLRRLIDADTSLETRQLMQEIRSDWALAAQKPAGTPPTVRSEPDLLHPNERSDVAAETQEKTGSPLLRVNVRHVNTGSTVDARVAGLIDELVSEALADAAWLYSVVDDPADMLDVDYELVCSVSPTEETIRIGLRLLKLPARTLTWMQFVETPAADTIRAAKELAIVATAALEREILISETSSAWSCPPEQLSAHGQQMLAIPLLFRLTPKALNEADSLLTSAAERLPQNGTPMAWKAIVGFLKFGQGFTSDSRASREELHFLTRRALELSPKNAFAVTVAGHVAAFVEHEYDLAFQFYERAQQLNPSSAYYWAFSALAHCYIGNTQEAIDRLEKYRSLWPIDPYPHFFNTARCIAASMHGAHEIAVSIAKKTIAENPNFNATYRPLISSLGHLKRYDEAKYFIDELKPRQPGFSLEWFKKNYPPLKSDQHDNYINGFIKAGLEND